MNVQSAAEQLLYATVRIDTKSPDGQAGSGTGFIFINGQGERAIPVIVTNKHVVSGFPQGSITFNRRDGEQPMLGHGYRLDIQDFSSAWFGHPDPAVDVTVMPLAPILEHINANGVSIFYRAITPDIVPDEKQILELDAFEELIFIGYPNGIWDKKNLLPVMRTGTTATPMAVDFEGSPTFLMDASVFPGSSGSPVFLYNPGMWYSKTGMTSIGTRLKFVGIVAAVFFRNDINDIVTVPIPTQNEKAVAVSREMIDLGIVFKARTVLETIQFLAKSRGVVF